MLWKVGLKEQRERKNKSKVTQELVERKVKKITRNTSKKRRESITQMQKKKGENSNVKEYGKLGKIK